MKRFTFFLLLFVLAAPAFVFVAPAWAAKKITVGQLEDMLRSMQRDKKTDVEVATALKQIELGEELTRATMNSLMGLAQGPYTTEQIYILEARSADLIPPASDLPSTPAPDADGQKAILAKAAAYVTGTYAQLPSLTAMRTTLRFQDNFEAVNASSGITGSASEVTTTAGFSKAASFVRYINSTAAPVALEHGAEVEAPEKDKTKWGANRMISLEQHDLNLNTVFQAAQESGSIQWLRWELINGKPAAVYSFGVPKKLTKLDVNICCFPKIDQQGIAHFYNATNGAAFGGAGGAGGVSGDFQTTTDWHEFTATPPFHGELFIDPDSGVIVRMITEAEFRPTEVVHQVDTRVDYAPVKAGGKVVVVPVKTFVNTLVVPGGESGSGTYTTRCTLFTSEYTHYETQASK